ncbi:hypothetical protein CR513_22089, partial [Mucuna pruriens]
MVHIHKYAAKARVAKRYNSIVFPRSIQKDDLVLRRILKGAATNKLTPNWEGPFRVREELNVIEFSLVTYENVCPVNATKTRERQSANDCLGH